jgi:uncharacterized protein YutE (UPF0331/DUF86 family)
MSLAAYFSYPETEAAFLENMRAEFEEKGYRFLVHPRPSELPEFFASYVPDAVALREDGNVAIELKSRETAANQQSLQRIRQLLEGQPGWQLRVAYMGREGGGTRRLPVSSRDSVRTQVREVERLVEGGNVRAAFVIAWSLLEAALNSARPNSDKRPRTPGTIVQTLAMEGLISEQMEIPLRALTDLRNRVIHGDLTAEPSQADVELVLSAVRAVLA